MYTKIITIFSFFIFIQCSSYSTVRSNNDDDQTYTAAYNSPPTQVSYININHLSKSRGFNRKNKKHHPRDFHKTNKKRNYKNSKRKKHYKNKKHKKHFIKEKPKRKNKKSYHKFYKKRKLNPKNIFFKPKKHKKQTPKKHLKNKRKKKKYNHKNRKKFQN